MSRFETDNLEVTNIANVGAITTSDIDTVIATTLLLGKSTATKVEIADTAVITEVQGPLDALAGLDVTGNITGTGYMQFADVTAPSNPANGEGRLYKKTGDDGIFWKPDSAGAEVDLTTVGGGVTDHGALTGLVDDDHAQYLLLAGRSGGQTANGGTAASEDLTLDSTAHATKGYIVNLSRIKAPDGTTALPSYTFSSDPDTGMYRESDGDLAFAQDGTCVFEIQTDNRLIISGQVPNYETLVTADNVIPNKKYVDDKTWDANDIVSGTLPIVRGGTGQSTAVAAFDALAPTTTKGDIVAYNGTDNVRVAIGSNNQVLTADSAQSSGVKWSTPSVYGTERHYVASDGESTTTSKTLQTKTTLTTGSLVGGTYRLGYTFEISNASNGVLSEVEIKLDGTIVGLTTFEADKDYHTLGGFVHQALAAGVRTATIKHRVQSSGTSKIRRARLELIRVA